MLKIWGRNNSSNVQKTMWAVGEIGIPHTRIDIGMAFGGNDQPAYLALNPNGLIPTIEDDGHFAQEAQSEHCTCGPEYCSGGLLA